MSESQPLTIDPNNMTSQQAFLVLWRCVNKAQQKGAFTIDESYALKLAAEKLAVELNMVQTQPQEPTQQSPNPTSQLNV